MNEFDDLEAILSQAYADAKVTVKGLRSHYDGYMNYAAILLLAHGLLRAIAEKIDGDIDAAYEIVKVIEDATSTEIEEVNNYIQALSRIYELAADVAEMERKLDEIETIARECADNLNLDYLTFSVGCILGVISREPGKNNGRNQEKDEID